jgi:hypothetical protein
MASAACESAKKDKIPTFLIDARFLLRSTTETFWGTPLMVVNGSDNTFCYGLMRDLAFAAGRWRGFVTKDAPSIWRSG